MLHAHSLGYTHHAFATHALTHWCIMIGIVSLQFAVQEVYGKEANKWLVYWRLFYIACSELFNLNGGEEYGLAHYTFRKIT